MDSSVDEVLASRQWQLIGLGMVVIVKRSAGFGTYGRSHTSLLGFAR
jgi:hypothetical protein